MLLTGNATDIESISGILSLNFTVTMTDGDRILVLTDSTTYFPSMLKVMTLTY